MLFEQKSRRKSSVEMEVRPYKSLTTLYFLIRFPQRFLAQAIKNCIIRMDKQIYFSIFLPEAIFEGIE